MKKIVYIILHVAAIQFGMAQTENGNNQQTTLVNANLSLRGRWQTGNLNQISLMPSGSLSIQNARSYLEMNSTFHYLRVNGFDVKNDLWNTILFQYQPDRRLFQSAHIIAGYASSYKINHSFVTGLGMGLNIHNKSRNDFIQVHCYGAYLDFQYEKQPSHKSISIGTLIKSKLPLSPIASFQWEMSSYHSMKDNVYWGGANLFLLKIKILKNLSLNIAHQTYYNNQTTIDITKTNTEMLFGIQYNFSNT